MLQYVVSQSDNDNFIITIMEGEYKSTAVKIVDLEMDESGELNFEIELPSNKAELFNDESFKNEISLIVGDVVKKSINALYKTQEDLVKIEENVSKILKEHNVERDENILLIEIFMQKGFLLKLDSEGEEEKYVAIDIHTNEVFDLSKEEDFEKVRQKVFSKIILN